MNKEDNGMATLVQIFLDVQLQNLEGKEVSDDGGLGDVVMELTSMTSFLIASTIKGVGIADIMDVMIEVIKTQLIAAKSEMLKAVAAASPEDARTKSVLDLVEEFKKGE